MRREVKEIYEGKTNDLARKAALSFTLNGSLNEREMSVSFVRHEKKQHEDTVIINSFNNNINKSPKVEPLVCASDGVV